MPINSTRQLTHLTSPAIEAINKRAGVLILPVGAIEQHGAHLPVCTDTLQVSAVLEAALAKLPDTVAAWQLPALPYGRSIEHAMFPGTFTLSSETLLAVLGDLGRSAARAGFRRLAFLNGHGGNIAVLDTAARDIRAATGMMTFCLHPALFVDAPFEITPQERKFGIHAGELETSLMLALAPERVDMSKAARHFPNFPDAAPPLGMFGNASAAWLTPDWSASGVFGDATLGTADKGRAMLAAATDRLSRLIAEISVFEVGA